MLSWIVKLNEELIDLKRIQLLPPKHESTQQLLRSFILENKLCIKY